MRKGKFFGKFLLWVLVIALVTGFGYFLSIKFIQNAFDDGGNNNSFMQEFSLSDMNSLQDDTSAVILNFLNMRDSSLASQDIYVVVFEIRQSTVTLDVGEHVKNKMNAAHLVVAVDKRYYDNVNVGDQMLSEMKMGSLIMDGDVSNIKCKVVGKYVYRADSSKEPNTVVVHTTDTVYLTTDSINNQ